jgi:hypothetical protein
MGEIVVKDNVRYTKKDANRVDVVTAGNAVQTKVPVEDTDAWRIEQERQVRTELEAELNAERGRAELALQAELDQKRADAEAEIAKLRADFDAELEQRRSGVEPAPTGEEVSAVIEPSTPEAVADQIEDEATKVVEPDVKKVVEPTTTKRRTSGSK